MKELYKGSVSLQCYVYAQNITFDYQKLDRHLQAGCQSSAVKASINLGARLCHSAEVVHENLLF